MLGVAWAVFRFMEEVVHLLGCWSLVCLVSIRFMSLSSFCVVGRSELAGKPRDLPWLSYRGCVSAGSKNLDHMSVYPATLRNN